MSVKTNDHRVLIADFASELSGQTREEMESNDLNFLGVAVWRNGNLSRVEMLLTCGGPTVKVIVDEYDRAELHHSWGMDSSGRDMQVYRFCDDDQTLWVEIAEQFRGNE